MAASASRLLRQMALLQLLLSLNDKHTQRVMGDLKTLNPFALLGCAGVFGKSSHALSVELIRLVERFPGTSLFYYTDITRATISRKALLSRLLATMIGGSLEGGPSQPR